MSRANITETLNFSNTRGKQSLRLWLRLLACEKEVEQSIRSKLRDEFSVTLPQFDVLSELERAGEPVTMSQLSDELMVSNGNVTGVVDRLLRDGFVRREASKSDRRVLFIALTPAGEKTFREMAAAHEQWISSLFSSLTTTEIRKLLKSMVDLKDSISENF